MQPYLSIVFPAYNEGQRIYTALQRTADYFKSWPEDIEIIVVGNGITDDTDIKANQAMLDIAKQPGCGNLILRYEMSPPGKGHACRVGLKMAAGHRILTTDVDLSTDLNETPRLVAAINDGADLAIGSRKLPGSMVLGLSTRRKLTSRLFTTMARPLTPGILDTQCGFKMITKAAARRICPRLTIGGFAYDVELLHAANQLGYTIKEVPVIWINNPDSKVKIIRDSYRMARDLIRIGVYHALGYYK